MFDMMRIAACVPEVSVADPETNGDRILEKLKTAEECGASVAVFPELAVTGYTCQDLFFQGTLLRQASAQSRRIVEATRGSSILVFFGAPLAFSGALYNGAYVCQNGRLLGITLKTCIPNDHEFYEKRWFRSGDGFPEKDIPLSRIFPEAALPEEEKERRIPCGTGLLYRTENGLTVGAEICEDLWSPAPPSTGMALGGADLVVNLSASNETIAKRSYRQSLVKHQSAACLCTYLYVSAGGSESTQDLIFSGHSIVAENGSVLNESRNFIEDDYLMIADLDPARTRHDRLVSRTFQDAAERYPGDSRYVEAEAVPESDGAYLPVKKHPFIPGGKDKRSRRCSEIFAMQTGGLAKRLRVTGSRPVVGVSGGMDSTLALLVAAGALKALHRPASDLIAVTMPAFGTTDRTCRNAMDLIRSLGAEPVVIDIREACLQHLRDLGQDPEIHDITFENTQARERTQVLMDYANKNGGLVVGTGDLSELALGWCTYNADQMSMYGVNGSIPKTLVRWVIQDAAENPLFKSSAEILKDILDTPISPELLPPDENGNITQKTEESVGPYELHDFFLYYMFRFGFSPAKIFFLAKKAFRDTYGDEEILKWLRFFCRRFFSQQFKRSCMPDCVKVGSVSLSPRGDLRMPSDAACKAWLTELDQLGA